MDGIAIGAIGSHDVPLLVAVLAFMLVTSALSGVWPSFGQLGRAERETRLAKALQDVSQGGDMEEEVRLLKASASRRVRRAYGGGFRASLKRVALFRLGHFLAVMALMVLVGAFGNLLAGQYYVSGENWQTLGYIALFCLGFEVVTRAVVCGCLAAGTPRYPTLST